MSGLANLTLFQRFLRRAIRTFCRWIPFHKGKTRLITWAFHHLTGPKGIILDHLRNGMPIEINPAEWIENEIYYLGYYEVYLAEFFRRLVKPGWIFADVGAHIGQYSLLAAECGATVHAFEPNPQNFVCLQRNIELNGLARVVLNPVAVSDHSGMSLFELPEASNTGNGSLKSRLSASNESVSVQVVTLDGYFQSQIASPDLIKLDIQGAEFLALQGASQILHTHAPLLILEADEKFAGNFGHSIPEIVSLLRGYDYCLYRMDRAHLRVLPAGESVESENLIACPSAKCELLPK